VNYSKRIEDLFEGSESDMVFISNSPHQDYMPCGGAFVIKNTPAAKEILFSWYYCNDLPEHYWHSVLSKYNINEKWEFGKYWEQDALWYIMHMNPKLLHVHPTEQQFSEKEGQLVRHMCHYYTTDFRTSFFRHIVTNLEPLFGQYSDIMEEVLSIEYDTSRHTWY
jgi:hypothetical protein